MVNDYSLQFVCDCIEAEFIPASSGSKAKEIFVNGLADPRNATINDVSFIASKNYVNTLSSIKACAVIVTSDLVSVNPAHSLVVENPYLAYAKLSALFAEVKPPAEVHLSASVSSTATVGRNCSIAANVVIEDGAIIGDDAVISAGAVIGARVKIGNRSFIYPNVSLYHDVVLGDDCIIHSGAVIGCDGFGFAPTVDGFVKIHQLGTVIIGNRVEIGANASIDRGALANTEIHDGVKIDNLVHIAHNCIVGKNTAIAGQVGMAGATEIGENCMIGGQAGIAGHLKIANNVQITGKSMVTKGIKQSGVYSSGTGFSDNLSWRKNAVRFNQLDDIYKRLLTIEKQTTDK